MLKLSNIKKAHGDWQLDIGFEQPEGEFLTLLGPSGCGKTTTLRIIAGFVLPDAGDIFFGSQLISSMLPHKRGVGIVFQDYALFPHLNVFENIAFGLRVTKKSQAEIVNKVTSLVELMHLDGLVRKRSYELSGGEQQRVALARALAVEPKILLLDEPLSALDRKLRIELRREIKSIHRALGLTTIYVTHDQEEALAISDRMAVMKAGKIEQIGTPDEIHYHPKTAFVASFVGDSNIIRGKIIDKVDHGKLLVEGGFVINDSTNKKIGEFVNLVLKAEDCFVSKVSQPGRQVSSIKAEVAEYEFAGGCYKLVVNALAQKFTLNVDSIDYQVGEQVYLTFDSAKALVLWD